MAMSSPPLSTMFLTLSISWRRILSAAGLTPSDGWNFSFCNMKPVANV